MNSVPNDCLEAADRLIAGVNVEVQGFRDMRPSFTVTDLAIENTLNDFSIHNIMGIKTAEHLKKSAAGLSEHVEFFDIPRKHLRSCNNSVVHQATIKRSFQNTTECHHVSKQDKSNSFSFKPFLSLAITSVRTGYMHSCQNDCHSSNRLNPSGGARMTLDPSQYRLGELETIEHLANLPRLRSIVEGATQ
jgi:hypothetical protein